VGTEPGIMGSNRPHLGFANPHRTATGFVKVLLPTNAVVVAIYIEFCQNRITMTLWKRLFSKRLLEPAKNCAA
jgi:hypothetical protein